MGRTYLEPFVARERRRRYISSQKALLEYQHGLCNVIEFLARLVSEAKDLPSQMIGERKMPNFNWEINLGTLISFATIVFAAGGFYVFAKNVGAKVDDIKEDLKALNKVIMDVALSNQRQDNFEKRTDDRFKMIMDDVRELKHGKGFVKDTV